MNTETAFCHPDGFFGEFPIFRKRDAVPTVLMWECLGEQVPIRIGVFCFSVHAKRQQKEAASENLGNRFLKPTTHLHAEDLKRRRAEVDLLHFHPRKVP